LNTAPGSTADQGAADQEQGQVRGRETHGDDEKDQTGQHGNGAEFEHTRGWQSGRHELGEHPAREHQEKGGARQGVRGTVQSGGQEKPGQPGE
jgi:hypothetical protein